MLLNAAGTGLVLVCELIALALIIVRSRGRARTFGLIGFAILIAAGLMSVAYGWLVPWLTDASDLGAGIGSLLLSLIWVGGPVFLALAIIAGTTDRRQEAPWTP